MELILNILQNCGPVFQSDEKIVSVVRDYLCVSLLSNCTSQITQITGLSLQVFIALLQKFKDYLKSELEVFITGIFIRILESENSTYDHKLKVLEVFHMICQDSLALVEIFINYDCDLEAIDLFRRIVDGFSKIAKVLKSVTFIFLLVNRQFKQNPSVSANNRSSIDFMSTGRKSLQDELLVRHMGLDGLIIILKSLLELGEYNTALKNDESAASKNDITVNLDGTSIIEDDNSALTVDSSATLHDKGNVVDVFDRKQKMQEEIESGILKFNLSPKKGIAYLASLNHIEYTPGSVAKFLIQYQDRLDKSVVGDYLGREREYENGFCTKVLHEYVDSMDFSSMAFDLAIRHFLNGFRIPGEAQKIDRIMEKFAERYYLQNRHTFASADMAFILAFSTIMLQTNLHNPAIRDDKRMTKEQFLRQNKGISSDGEIPDDMLSDIYDRIAAEPIRITHEDKALRKPKKEEQSFGVFTVSLDKKRKDAFNSERIEMVRTSEALFRQLQRRGNHFVRKTFLTNSEDVMYVRPMFEVAWAPIMGVLSQVLETSDDESSVNLCLTGFRYSLHLACRLDIPIARDTFINALSNFTTLETVKEMHDKNIACIKTLLEVAILEKDYINESWQQILKCISQLARLQLFASGVHTDDVFFSETASVASSEHSNGSSSMKMQRKSQKSRLNDKYNPIASSYDPFKFFSGPTKAEVARLVEESNADIIMREISPEIIDQIFFNSQYLSEESVFHFVKSLCEVSMLEINIASAMNSIRGKEVSIETLTPRIFSLQKLVEVADLNMHSRPRIAWANIWNFLTRYFTSVGVSENIALSMYAIDSLKQLSIKFLQKEELSNFNFQRVFLKPFEVVMSKSKSLETKDLVLGCIDIMIRTCANNIRSGWRSIFAILEVAASQDSIEISNIAFDIIERLMDSQFDLLIFDFVELMNCLVAFVSGKNTSISMRALSFLGKCADNLAAGKVSPALELQHTSTDSMGISWEKSNNDVNNLNSGEASVFRLWWPLLLGLSTRVSDTRISVRKGALKTLEHVLKTYGYMFSSQTWSVINKGVLFPMMDSAKTDFSQQLSSQYPSQNPAFKFSRNSWIGTMGEAVLSLCLDLFFLFGMKEDCILLLADLLNMLESCVCQDIEVLSKMALRAIYSLVISRQEPSDSTESSFKFSCDISNLVSKKVCSIVVQNLGFYFAEIGNLEYVNETPDVIRQKNILGCPLHLRRQLKRQGSLNNRDELLKVNTAYGEGIIEKVCKTIYP